MIAYRDDIAFLISSSSIDSWWRGLAGSLRFCSSYLLKAEEEDCGVICDRLLASAPNTTRFVFLSSHESLDRDAAIAERLEKQGFPTPFGVSALAAQLGQDKIRMKEVFDRIGIPTPPWWRKESGLRWPSEPIVRKASDGTMGKGNRLTSASSAKGRNREYFEKFVYGDEYSVFLVRLGQQTLMLPVVWKGPTNLGLIPPYRRARLCSELHSQGPVQSELYRISASIAEGLEYQGFMEVEFVVAEDRFPLVLEINPRVAGTTRMAALSADYPIFQYPLDPGISGPLRPKQLALELPLASPLNPQLQLEGVYSTSRATIVASSTEQLSSRLDTLLTAGAEVPEEALQTALRELQRLYSAPVSQNRDWRSEERLIVMFKGINSH
jgi:carbamoylphosphate synthase large subunit